MIGDVLRVLRFILRTLDGKPQAKLWALLAMLFGLASGGVKAALLASVNVFKRFFYLELLPELRARGKTVFVITHDDAYFHLADRILRFENGRTAPVSEEEEKRFATGFAAIGG